MQLVKRLLPVTLIGFVVVLIAVLNYKPGTILTGWDNLHPEYNFAANIKRSIFAVWQEYQGLGLLGGMGHSSDLLRQIFLLILSSFMPVTFLRFFWTFLTLFIGGVGSYFLIKNLSGSKFASTLGAIFYILNLSTVQAYYVPFEVFTAHFAVLPWLILGSLNFFRNSSKKTLLIFVIILFLATPAAYVPTLFAVYLIAVTIVLGFLVFKDFNRNSIAKFLKTYLVIFLINAFWLLPFTYFIIFNSGVVINAKINEMATPTIYQQNKEFGGIFDVMLLKGFWLNNIDPNFDGNFTYMFKPWKLYLENLWVNAIGYILFAVSLLGVFSAIKSKKPLLLGFAALFVFSFTMLATATPPFSWIDSVFRIIPLFKEVFRFPFTKFSILTSLTYAIFFAFGVLWISKWVGKIPVFIASVVLIAVFVYPIFTGSFIYEKEQLKLPSEYQSLFTFFKGQDQNTRIANLPQPIFWGWTFYNWGYGGSGFPWYGIKQPILDRAFDVWSNYNENYYWELSEAIYSKSQPDFENVLNKYQINWLLIDKNIIYPSAPQALFVREIKSLINFSEEIKKVKEFGKLEIYKVNLREVPKSFVFNTTALPKVNYFTWGGDDKAYKELGNYISLEKGEFNYFYPFRTFFSGKSEKDKEFEIEEGISDISFINAVFDTDSLNLKIPKLSDKENVVASEIYSEKNSDNTVTVYARLRSPQIEIQREGKVEKIWGKEVKLPLFILGGSTNFPVKMNLNGIANFAINPKSEFLGTTGLSFAGNNVFTITDAQGKSGEQSVKGEDLKTLFNVLPQEILVKNVKAKDKIKVVFPKINDGYQGLSLSPNKEISKQASSCDSFRRGETKSEFIEKGEKAIRLSSRNATLCMSFYMDSLDHGSSYLFAFENRSIKDRPLHFWVLNENEKFAPIDTYIKSNKKMASSYFVLSPQEEFGRGYSLHLDNISIGSSETINEFGRISAYPIPYNFLTSLKFEKGTFNSGETESAILNVSHPNESLYVVGYDPSRIQGKTIVLSQSYDKGWTAYQITGKPNLFQTAFPFILGKGIKNHVMVNNWANGWIMENGKLANGKFIVIVYLPQYLQYLGFILTLGTIIFVIFKTLKSKPIN